MPAGERMWYVVKDSYMLGDCITLLLSFYSSWCVLTFDMFSLKLNSALSEFWLFRKALRSLKLTREGYLLSLACVSLSSGSWFASASGLTIVWNYSSFSDGSFSMLGSIATNRLRSINSFHSRSDSSTLRASAMNRRLWIMDTMFVSCSSSALPLANALWASDWRHRKHLGSILLKNCYSPWRLWIFSTWFFWDFRGSVFSYFMFSGLSAALILAFASGLSGGWGLLAWS